MALDMEESNIERLISYQIVQDLYPKNSTK